MTQVKQHIFFKDINWDTLARQKVHLFNFAFEDLSFAEADSHAIPKFNTIFL